MKLTKSNPFMEKYLRVIINREKLLVGGGLMEQYLSPIDW